MDAVRLRAVRAYGRHGADPRERERRQLIEVDVTAQLDLGPAQSSDDLSQTVDYAALRDRLVRVVATTSYALLERLAAELLTAVFADARVARATVAVSKPDVLGGATPSVIVERANPRYAP